MNLLNMYTNIDKSMYENYIDEYQNTLLHVWIMKNGCINMFKSLLQYESNVSKENKFGLTPLHIACKYGNIECAKILLENGANKDANAEKFSKKYKLTPYYIAYVNNHMECANLLLDMGADTKVFNHPNCKSYRHLFETGATKCIKQLQKKGKAKSAKSLASFYRT